MIDNITGSIDISNKFGIQSLDPQVQRRIRRRNNRQKTASVLGKLKEREIKFECHLIYGLPRQTLTSFQQDHAFLKQYTDTVKQFPLVRLLGTALDQQVQDEIRFSNLFPKEVIETQWMDRETILQIKQEVN
ncbi:MAG: hypothetical protein INQ03_21265 [Candidatus Heimdallarchaeota archaeon]|nr:hypothetical protein [Candidatus Heimdallarchaeota archaeon]